MFVCHGLLLNTIVDGQVTMPAADLTTIEAAQASLSTPAGAANLIAQINHTNAEMGTYLVLPDLASITVSVPALATHVISSVTPTTWSAPSMVYAGLPVTITVSNAFGLKLGPNQDAAKAPACLQL